MERRFVEDLLGVPLVALSFHIASPFTQACRKTSYAGLVNANGEYLQIGSRLLLGFEWLLEIKRLEDVLREAEFPRLQVLTHPGLWQETVMSPRQRCPSLH